MNLALHIIETCLSHGVRHFCFAPGSRSTPLIVALSKVARARLHVHFDERGLAFFALGLAKRYGSPVAVITTSGSAVGNLLPALMEADAAHIPLVLITADRPFELRGCGANQTTDQVKIFEPFVRHHLDLPASDQMHTQALLRQIAHALYKAKHGRRGPIHINCQFREPFTFITEEAELSPIHYTTTFPLPSPTDLKVWADAIGRAKRGVILAGADAFEETAEPLVALANQLCWPLLADPLSGVRGQSSDAIAHYNYLLNESPDAILHFGDRLVSKPLLQWLDASRPAFYGLVSPHPHHHDPIYSITHRMTTPPENFCSEIISHLPKAESHVWLRSWQQRSVEVASTIDKHFASESAPTEPGLFLFLARHLPTAWSLFVANSMPIRDADSFFFPKDSFFTLFGNRGVSGIDGNIATALGCADIAVIGDLSALHDINSLALVKERKQPCILIVINNQGGGIFSFLPVHSEHKEHFEPHFAASHDYTFKHAAALFDIAYVAPKSRFELEECLLKLFERAETTLIEVQTNRKENLALHERIAKRCSPTA